MLPYPSVNNIEQKLFTSGLHLLNCCAASDCEPLLAYLNFAVESSVEAVMIMLMSTIFVCDCDVLIYVCD